MSLSSRKRHEEICQVYDGKKRAKHIIANQTTSEKFNNCIDKQKKQKVLIIVLVSVRMCVKLRSKMFGSCFGKNEFILGNLILLMVYQPSWVI